jgi:hypothetical protein
VTRLKEKGVTTKCVDCPIMEDWHLPPILIEYAILIHFVQQGTLTAKAKQQQNGAHFHHRCQITCPNVIRYVHPFSPLLLLLVD